MFYVYIKMKERPCGDAYIWKVLWRIVQVPKVLVAEDEQAIAELIQMNLRFADFDSVWVSRGDAVIPAIQQENPDIILLDVMLPGIDGFSLMKKIEPLHIPVIFLTAKDSLADKVTGLKLGADDYIVKPFETLELISRIEAVLRRTRAPASGHIEIDGLLIKPDERVALKDGQPVELTAKEFALLDALVKNKNIALSRDRLLEMVWGYDYIGDTRTVDVHISNLRKKLGLTDRIKTVSKHGYRLEVTP